MEGLCRHDRGINKFVPYKDGTVTWIMFDSEPNKEYGGITSFKIAELDRVFSLPHPTYPLDLGDRVRIFDELDFRGDSHGIVEPEGLQHLSSDGTPTSKFYRRNKTQYDFKEMP